MNNIKYVLIFSALCIFLFACGKEEPKYTIPAAPVNYLINTNFLDNHLANGGNIGVYIKSNEKETYDQQMGNVKGVKTFVAERAGVAYFGYSGLLIINTGQTLAETPFVAFDLCCPYEDSEHIRVFPTSDGTAKCSKCNSIFDIMLGTGRPISGVCSENLQSYYVRKEGEQAFRIFYP